MDVTPGEGGHPWLKFPIWSRVEKATVKIGKMDAYLLSRKKTNDYLFDQIYVACFDIDQIVAVRFISLGPSNKVGRAKAIQEFMQMIVGNDEAIGSHRLDKIKIDPKNFIDGRDVPNTLLGASARLANDLTIEERKHLLKNIHNENDLFEQWPTNGDRVSRLHWIMIYWGLNDPNSPLRKSIGKPPGSDNGSYVLEVLKSTEKLLREKS